MVGLVFISDIAYCPYLKKYQDIFEKAGVEYEVLYWKREKGSDLADKKFKYFDLPSKKNRSPFRKIKDFYLFRRWLIKKIKERNYTNIVLLSTLSGMVISDILLRDYKGKYIFDIRDYSYEEIAFFKAIEKKLIHNSYFTCVSSPGFLNFLPDYENYILTHNFDKYELKNERSFIKKTYGETLNLVFLGGVRYFKHQREIIINLSNDPRFNLVYHGSGIELNKFKKFVKENDINNVTFTGKYDNKDKNKLLENADILNNSYISDNFMEVKYAISNKYYDGIIYSIPQLVEHGTYKGKMIEEKDLGISLKVNKPNFGDILYQYYMRIDENEFNKACRNEISDILEEDHIYECKIKEFIKF